MSKKKHPTALNTEPSPQDTPRGKSLGGYYWKASLDALFLYASISPLAFPICQGRRKDTRLAFHSCAYICT